MMMHSESGNLILLGDAAEHLRALPDESADCCITSPPYYGLRDYKTAGQIGLEKSPEEYIGNLVSVFREVKRVLKDDGTLWVNIGDSYAGSGKGATNNGESEWNKTAKNLKECTGINAPKKTGWGECKPKDLVGIPWMLAFALRADGWYLRQDIIWEKGNAMPSSVRDRCSTSHEYIFLLSKSRHYYYDADAIAEPAKTGGSKLPSKVRFGGKKYTENKDVFYRTKSGNLYNYTGFRNKRSVWHVNTKPFKEAHFATYPPELIVPCVLAGCPKGGTVLDPFFGSGTTGEVAVKHGRKYIGVEINEKYIEIARKRIAPHEAQMVLDI
jgi:DNA modification methylase